jgi:hypothetical protein
MAKMEVSRVTRWESSMKVRVEKKLAPKKNYWSETKKY